MNNEPNVEPYFETAEVLGIPAKDWLIKMVKSKTLWFSTALTILGFIQLYLPNFQALLGNHSAAIMAVIGIISAVLRFGTTEAIADKPVSTPTV